MLKQASELTDLLVAHPLEAILALCILGIIALTGWVVRIYGKLQAEQREHLITAKEISTLAGSMEKTWSAQLSQDEAKLELQAKTIMALERSLTLIEGAKGVRV